jgi:hypothetical protein
MHSMKIQSRKAKDGQIYRSAWDVLRSAELGGSVNKFVDLEAIQKLMIGVSIFYFSKALKCFNALATDMKEKPADYHSGDCTREPYFERHRKIDDIKGLKQAIESYAD